MKLDTTLIVPSGLPNAGEDIKVGGTTDRPLFDAVDFGRVSIAPLGNRSIRSRHAALPKRVKGWIGKRHAVDIAGAGMLVWGSDGPLLNWLSAENLRLIRLQPPAPAVPSEDYWNEQHVKLMLARYPHHFSVLSAAHREIEVATAARRKVHPGRTDRLDTILGRNWKREAKLAGIEPCDFTMPLWMPEKGKLVQVHVYNGTLLPLFRGFLVNEIRYNLSEWAGDAYEDVLSCLFCSYPALGGDLNWEGIVRGKILKFCQVTGAEVPVVWKGIYKAYEAVTGDNLFKMDGQPPLAYIRSIDAGGAFTEIVDKVLGEWLPSFSKAFEIERLAA